MTKYDDDGQFWLPEDPQRKIGGRLSCSPGERPVLTLMGSFGSLTDEIEFLRTWHVPHREKVIHGRLAVGRNVTLQECRASNGGVIDFEFGGVVAKSFEAETAIVGLHLAPSDEQEYSRFAVDLCHLEEWADLFHAEKGMCPRVDDGVFVVGYRQPPAIDIALQGEWRLRVGVSLNGPGYSRPQRRISVVPTTWLELSPPAGCLLREGQRRTQTFVTFLSLAAQAVCFPRQLRVSPWEMAQSEDPRVRLDSVRVMYRNPDAAVEPRESLPPDDFLFVLSDLDAPAENVQCWERAAAEISSTISLYMAELREPAISLEPRFLRFVQALEGYHRRRFSNATMPQLEYEEQVAKIVAASPERYRSWLARKLRHSNEPGLAMRISELCRTYAPIVDKIDTRRDWCEEVADVRNRLAHQTAPITEGEIGDVLTLTERMKMLLDLCLLTECGFELGQIQALVERYWKTHPPMLAIDAASLLY